MSPLQIPEVSRLVKDIGQQHYGDHTLDAISGTGCTGQPRLALVFINPTHRNISTHQDWKVLKRLGLAVLTSGNCLPTLV